MIGSCLVTSDVPGDGCSMSVATGGGQEIMRAKTIVPLIIGLAVGFFAIKMGVDMVKKAKGSQDERRKVYVTAKPIEVASKITKSMLAARDVPESLVPGDAFTDAKELIGRVTKMPIAAGVPLTNAMLAPPGAQPGLGARIPAGYRAVSVSVNEQSSVAGFITPGSRVDVSAVSGRKETSSRLILSNIEVGAVGQSLDRTGPDGKAVQITKSVTLFLKPTQVQVLNAAVGSRKGRIRLALRGYGSEPGPSFLSQLLTNAMQTQAPKARPAKPKTAPKTRHARFHVVEVRRGEQAEQLVFDENGGLRQGDLRELLSQSKGRGGSSEGDDDTQKRRRMEADG